MDFNGDHVGNVHREQTKNEYMQKLMPLFAYIPYFKEKEGAKTRSFYDGQKVDSVPVPVYDGTVLSFVKEAQKTGLIDRNYIYAYQKIKANGPKDERLFLTDATFLDLDIIISIIAKYVLGGMTKGVMWSDAVEEGVWLHCLLKLKELLEVYDHPLA